MDDNNYKGLSANEELAIVLFLDGNDRHALDDIISQGDMTKDMRRFVANVDSGIVKRPARKKSSNDLRDMKIYNAIEHLRPEDNPLPIRTAGRNVGAAETVGDNFCVVEETAIKAYKKLNRAMNDAVREVLEEPLSVKSDRTPSDF
ncbi:hypothetical protein B0F87_10233 [Methylobacter tundripaludum]|uniref:Uncharacterized protein n=1 Tax=Methylobacter tundripaludum TaxID=173365 RepID=A0A2S6HHH8_9GAMM|nr:hypothetical protein [Methylobacter tundripaludum]PPK76929.1 hypothetical protein B0F87_10233 [Methylobacter tundripaludum]